MNTMTSKKPVSARMVGVLAGLTVAATTLIAAPAPARADGVDDAFINALNSAGVTFDNADIAKSVAHAICPLVKKGGKTVAWNYAKSQGNMPPAMASTFTAVAVQSYCPSYLKNLLGG
jgi:Protein of unknown function (DUF732)